MINNCPLCNKKLIRLSHENFVCKDHNFYYNIRYYITDFKINDITCRIDTSRTDNKTEIYYNNNKIVLNYYVAPDDNLVKQITKIIKLRLFT